LPSPPPTPVFKLSGRADLAKSYQRKNSPTSKKFFSICLKGKISYDEYLLTARK
jgi:hypothetical protein